MTIVDSTVWIDYLNGRDTAQTAWLESHLRTEELAITDLIHCEVLQGAKDDARFNQIRAVLAGISILPTISPGMEVLAANNYRFLRKRGITVRKTIDCLVATFCIENEHYLLQRDRDFEPFAKYLGLKLVKTEN